MTIVVKKTVEVRVPLIGEGDNLLLITRSTEDSTLLIDGNEASSHVQSVCARDLIDALRELYPEGAKHLPGSEKAPGDRPEPFEEMRKVFMDLDIALTDLGSDANPGHRVTLYATAINTLEGVLYR